MKVIDHKLAEPVSAIAILGKDDLPTPVTVLAHRRIVTIDRLVSVLVDGEDKPRWIDHGRIRKDAKP